MAVLALHVLFLTNVGHRCEESRVESQFASVCFLGPEVLGGVEAGMGLTAISGLSSRLTGKPQCPAPHHLDKGLTVSLLRINMASLSITNSQSLLKLMPIESVMTSNHLTSRKTI